MTTSSAPLTIRRAASADAQQLAEMNRAFNGATQLANRVRESLESLTEIVLVAEYAGALAGFITLHPMHSFCYERPWAEITELYVVPEHRRIGIGTALLAEAVSTAGNVGAAQVWLRTGHENKGAQQTYRRAGFEVTREIVCRRFLSADIP